MSAIGVVEGNDRIGGDIVTESVETIKTDSVETDQEHEEALQSDMSRTV